ncbi:ATP-dependent helicase [Bacillus sp. CMF21]|nr:ATP-dependent helicase [Bacillus sp. CMF21]
MKFINDIFGKTKLEEEILELKNQLNSLNIKLQYKNQLIQDLKKNNELKEKEIIKADTNMKQKDILIKHMKMDINSKNIDLVNKNLELNKTEEIISVYSNLYGRIEIKEKIEHKGLSELDEDKSFFEYLKPKNDNNDFNFEQIEAIRYKMNNHLRIIAGAGSGKTQTICAKAAYFVMMNNVRQEKIAMFTFTNKAAEEMEERVKDFLEEGKIKISIGTFHRIFKELYNELKNKFPYVSSMGINGDDPSRGAHNYRRLLNSLIKKYRLKKLDEDAGEKNLLEKISYWTNMGFSLNEMSEFIKKHYNVLEPQSDQPINHRFLEMMNEFYQTRKSQNILVFDDQMINLLQVLKQDIEARDYIQQRFEYIFIDEFQDTNPLQMEIIKLICPPDKDNVAKLIIVGDDDQSIYFFRGAEPKFIKEFDQIYSPTDTLTLMTNYRSIAPIVQAGNRVIKYNEGNRISKDMIPFHNMEGDCFIKALTNQEEEAEWIINQSQKLGRENSNRESLTTPDYTKSVILYRSNTQLKTMLHQMEVNQIPFVIDTNDDLMGIFNIDEFKKAFRNWENFLNEEVNKKYEWNKIVSQTAYAFYKKKQDVMKFIEKDGAYITPQNAAEFICDRKNENKRELVTKYLKELINLKNKQSICIASIIKVYLSFPLIENKLTKEEIRWIEKEADQFDSWNDLIERFNELKKKKEEMKNKLEDYRAGKYNALYLLTIHKSKGLSFENVFLIGVHNEGLPNKRAVKVSQTQLLSFIEQAEPPSTIEEERRLMYVAVTRPKKNLYITFPKYINDKPCKRSEFLKEIALPVNN